MNNKSKCNKGLRDNYIYIKFKMLARYHNLYHKFVRQQVFRIFYGNLA